MHMHSNGYGCRHTGKSCVFDSSPQASLNIHRSSVNWSRATTRESETSSRIKSKAQHAAAGIIKWFCRPGLLARQVMCHSTYPCITLVAPLSTNLTANRDFGVGGQGDHSPQPTFGTNWGQSQGRTKDLARRSDVDDVHDETFCPIHAVKERRSLLGLDALHPPLVRGWGWGCAWIYPASRGDKRGF